MRSASLVLALYFWLVVTGYASTPGSENETKTMKTDITKVQVHELAQSGPTLVVLTADPSATPVERYRRGTVRQGPLPAGKAVVGIFRSVVLSGPDQLVVTETAQRGNVVLVEIERRGYVGPLAANVETIALIQVELGSLTSGTYELKVVETVLEFQDLQHPENTINPVTHVHQLQFEVQ